MQPIRRRLVTAVATALVLASLTAAPATAGRKRTPTHGGRGCSMLSSAVDAPEPLVAPFVPDRFTTREGYLPGHVALSW